MTEEDLFLRALDLPAAERPAFLAGACGGDDGLRRRVDGLLAAHDNPGSFLAGPAVGLATADPPATADHTAPTEEIGTRIGPYKLLQQLGEGGMGTVWVAEQEHPVKRRVALKVVKPGMDSARVVARFEQERQALALMDHTNIAKVLDAGTTPNGRPYFVMELVKGVPITTYCDELHLSVRERLDLFVQVCAAVQHAHQKGVIHRDLKPSNVLVAVQDGKPVPKVIDFGVAKALHTKLAERTLYTEIGAVIGTFEYMAPEQAELSALDIDTRADVYALGVLLYELLTGSTPLTRQRVKSAALAEVLRIIKEEEPPKPSTRLTASQEALASLAAKRRTEPKRLSAEVCGELDWIVMKALEKDRTRRYDTATGFARDVQRYLGDEPVEACPPSAGYRLRKYARKHRTAFATAAAFLGLLVAGVVVSSWQAVVATRAQADAEGQRAEAAAAGHRAEEQRAAAESAKQLAEQNGQRAEANKETALDQLYIANMHRIHYEFEQNRPGRAIVLLDRSRRPEPGAKDRRGWEWHYWDRMGRQELYPINVNEGSPVEDAAFSPDGKLIASCGQDHIKLWDATTGQPVTTLPGSALHLAFSPDGRLLVSNGIKEVRLWDVARRSEIRPLQGESGGFAFAPDGQTLAVSSARAGQIRFWDLGRETWTGSLPKGTSTGFTAYSPDGSTLALARPDGIQLWDVTQGKPQQTLTGHSFRTLGADGQADEAIRGIAYSPDGRTVASCSRDGTVRLYDVASRQVRRAITVMAAGRDLGLSGVAFSPDGRHIVTASHGSPLKLWDADTGYFVRDFVGLGTTECVAFSRDGTRLAAAGRQFMVWDATSDATTNPLPGGLKDTLLPCYSRDGKLLAVQHDRGSNANRASLDFIEVRDADSGRRIARLEAGPLFARRLAFHPDGTVVACASVFYSDSGLETVTAEIKLWDIATGQVVGSFREDWSSYTSGGYSHLTFSPDGGLVAAATVRSSPRSAQTPGERQKSLREIELWDVATGKQTRAIPGTHVEFSPKGDVLAVADPDRNLLLFNWKTNELRLKVPNDKPASQISFSPDGRRVFYAGAVREVATGRVIYEIPGSDINTVFGPDGTRLFSATRNSARSSDLHVWDAATGELLCRVRVPGSVFSLHPDGYRIAVASNVDSSGSDYTTMWIVDARPVTPEIRDERDAQALVAHLFRQPLLKDEVVAHLRHSKTVSEPVRRKALALVQTLDAEADLLDEESRRVVDFAGDTPERYRRALAWARESVRQSPKYYPFQNRLGMALYRTGEYAEAAEVLRRSYQLLVDISPTGTTSRGALDLVFLAMTQHQLGQKDDARATLALARDPKINPIWVSPHFWREAEALIEGKGGEPKD